MAINEDNTAPTSSVEADEVRVRTAALALRAHTDERWVEVADHVLSQVLSVSRPAHPVRAQAASGHFMVSEEVLRASLQRAFDPVPHCEVTHIHVHADRDRYTGVTVIITAQYPHPLIPLADQIRDAAQRRLAEILGPVTPEVTVSGMRVHVGDVTPDNPKLG